MLGEYVQNFAFHYGRNFMFISPSMGIKELIKNDISRVRDLLGLAGFNDPRETMERLVKERLR